MSELFGASNIVVEEISSEINLGLFFVAQKVDKFPFKNTPFGTLVVCIKILYHTLKHLSVFQHFRPNPKKLLDGDMKYDL